MKTINDWLHYFYKHFCICLILLVILNLGIPQTSYAAPLSYYGSLSYLVANVNSAQNTVSIAQAQQTLNQAIQAFQELSEVAESDLKNATLAIANSSQTKKNLKLQSNPLQEQIQNKFLFSQEKILDFNEDFANFIERIKPALDNAPNSVKNEITKTIFATKQEIENTNNAIEILFKDAQSSDQELIAYFGTKVKQDLQNITQKLMSIKEIIAPFSQWCLIQDKDNLKPVFSKC